MICPYCKKEIKDNTGFCPECGQDISVTENKNQTDIYWRNINKEGVKRSEEYKSLVKRSKQEAAKRRNKYLLTTVFVLVLIGGSVLGLIRFQQYQKQMLEEVNAGLVGKTLTAHSSHMEGLGWIHHEYWQLTFIDEGNLEYAYIQTVGPKEDDENPEYKGTYSYSVSRSITGKYTIEVNGESYELKVDDDNVPKSISH